MNQQIDNWKTVYVWIASIVLACIIWWFGPGVYVSVQQMLPATMVGGGNVEYSQQSKQAARLRAKVNALRQENRRLRLSGQPDTLSATSSLADDYAKGSVIARPPLSPYDTLLLNIGRNNGLAIGAPVWWPPGIYLGEVKEVRQETALVTLVSSANQRHPGRLGESAVIETVGQGGGKIQAVVPKDLSVSTSSKVVSDRYGLVYGKVVDTKSGSLPSQRKLLIQPSVPATVIENVYVGKSS